MMSRNKDSSLFDWGSLSRLPTQSEFFNGFCMWNLLLVSSLKLEPSVKVGHSLKQNISCKLVSCGIFFFHLEPALFSLVTCFNGQCRFKRWSGAGSVLYQGLSAWNFPVLANWKNSATQRKTVLSPVELCVIPNRQWLTEVKRRLTANVFSNYRSVYCVEITDCCC